VAKKNKILKLTQIKSSIGYKPKAKATLKALGLRKISHVVEKNDSPSIRGMINSIPYLLKVEEK
tara:strand:- start:262 stop:453 length:192 start_codon:yes stop_codon:yes gene_type:complete